MSEVRFSTDTVACRISRPDAELIRRLAHARGVSVSSFLRELIAQPLAELRRAA